MKEEQRRLHFEKRMLGLEIVLEAFMDIMKTTAPADVVEAISSLQKQWKEATDTLLKELKDG